MRYELSPLVLGSLSFLSFAPPAPTSLASSLASLQAVDADVKEHADSLRAGERSSF